MFHPERNDERGCLVWLPVGPVCWAEIESRAEALPGAAATIVCSNGSSWTGVYGEEALGSGRLIAADSVFQIASVS